MATAICTLPLMLLGLAGMNHDFEGGHGHGGAYGVSEPINETAVEMNGDIVTETKDDFDDLMFDYPDINLIVVQDCRGSDDCIATHLEPNSLIASGAVDMFLAGTKRAMEGTTAMIGVRMVRRPE